MSTKSLTTYTVDPSRLDHGVWSPEHNRQIGEGDVSASYSADTIAFKSRVRRPFTYRQALWVCTGTGGRLGSVAEAYRLTEAEQFDGDPTTYGEKVRDSEAARSDPNGFYHGMTVKHGGREHVLTGPPAVFVAGETEQLDLFGS